MIKAELSHDKRFLVMGEVNIALPHENGTVGTYTGVMVVDLFSFQDKDTVKVAPILLEQYPDQDYDADELEHIVHATALAVNGTRHAIEADDFETIIEKTKLYSDVALVYTFDLEHRHDIEHTLLKDAYFELDNILMSLDVQAKTFDMGDVEELMTPHFKYLVLIARGLMAV